jgi:hypothetical protein
LRWEERIKYSVSAFFLFVFEPSTQCSKHIRSIDISSVCEVVDNDYWMLEYSILFYILSVFFQNWIIRCPIPINIETLIHTFQDILFFHFTQTLNHFLRTFYSEIIILQIGIQSHACCNKTFNIVKPMLLHSKFLRFIEYTDRSQVFFNNVVITNTLHCIISEWCSLTILSITHAML